MIESIASNAREKNGKKWCDLFSLYYLCTKFDEQVTI
jgi:hypothetical protein